VKEAEALLTELPLRFHGKQKASSGSLFGYVFDPGRRGFADCLFCFSLAAF